MTVSDFDRHTGALQMKLDRDLFRPLIAEVVELTLEKVGAVDGRIAYSEAEAAQLLGLATHQLRDRRLEGLVKATKIGRQWFYRRADLDALLSD